MPSSVALVTFTTLAIQSGLAHGFSLALQNLWIDLSGSIKEIKHAIANEHMLVKGYRSYFAHDDSRIAAHLA